MPLGQVAHATPAPNVYWPLAHAAHTLPAPASKPALHAHSVAAVLPAADVASLGHGSQGPGPVAALNEPARQRTHAVLRPEYPGLHAHAACDTAPTLESEFAGHGVAAVNASAPPEGVPRQNEPAGHGSHVCEAAT